MKILDSLPSSASNLSSRAGRGYQLPFLPFNALYSGWERCCSIYRVTSAMMLRLHNEERTARKTDEITITRDTIVFGCKDGTHYHVMFTWPRSGKRYFQHGRRRYLTSYVPIQTGQHHLCRHSKGSPRKQTMTYGGWGVARNKHPDNSAAGSESRNSSPFSATKT